MPDVELEVKPMLLTLLAVTLFLGPPVALACHSAALPRLSEPRPQSDGGAQGPLALGWRRFDSHRFVG